MRLALLIALSLGGPALAADPRPSVQVKDDGSVVGRVVLDASEAEVRQAVEAVQHSRNSSVLEIRFTPEGACKSVFRKTRGLVSPLTLKTRLCPTATGWREYLVESSDFDAWETEWILRPQASGGVSVQLSVRSDVNLMVPSSLVQQHTVRSVRESFADVIGRLLKPKKTSE